MPVANQWGECDTAGEILPATIALTMPEINPCNDDAMPRRVGNISSTISENEGIAIAQPSA